MSMHDCDRFQDRLTAALLDGVAPPDAVLVEGRQCPACATVLQDLTTAIAPASTVEPSPQATDRAIADGSRWARRAFAIAKLINVSISITLVTLWLLLVELELRSGAGLRWPPTGLGARAITVVASVVVIGYLALHGRIRAGRRERLYARWPRRQLQGVCVGIAEYVGLPLWLVRLAFVALFVTGLGGGTIYFLLAFLVSFHPDDRRYMRWFRIQRWWRRRRGQPEPA